MQCPCHSNKPYSECCFVFHENQKLPNSLELMRSRYAAYALCLPDYIIQTTHSTNPACIADKNLWKNQIRQFCQITRFEGLNILSSLENEDVASVKFTAVLTQNGHDVSFTENSHFILENGRWFYINGDLS